MKIKFEIRIETKENLTDEEILQIRDNISYRLQGYQNEAPKSMNRAKVILQYIIE